MASEPTNIPPDDSADDEYVRIKQDTFFLACDRRGYSRVDLAERSGISADTLRIYVTVPSRPKSSIMSLAMVRRLIRAVPAELGSILIDGTGVHLVADDPKPAGWLTLAERMSGFVGKVLRYQATGPGIDHREEADLREDIITIIAEGEGQVRG